MTADRVPDPTPPVLVTGATGTIGRHVVAGLQAAGRSVRAAVPHPERADELGARVSLVRFSFTDPSTWAATFDGAQVMFLMRPPQLSNIGRDMVPALRAAQDAGVRHVVLLSLQGAESNKIVPHAKIEAWLRGSELGWTFVRPSFFMENLTGTHATDIRDRDEIIVPAGRGATSFIAARDVAAVAVAALLDPSGHSGQAWTPTGEAALTYTQVAAVLTDALGRSISYRRPGLIRYARHARQTLGMPWGMVAVTAAIYTVARLGRAAATTDDVRAVTGAGPTTFKDWALDHANVWARP